MGRSYLRKYLRSAAICAACTASSLCARATSMSLLAFLQRFLGQALGLGGLRLVEVLAADGGVGQHGHRARLHSRMPPATKTNSSSPLSARSMRTAPGLMRVMSGV
jgi:hypothetical protein